MIIAPYVQTSHNSSMSVADAPPRISLICEGLATATGGAERALCDLANHLASRGYRVDVVTHELACGPAWYPLSDKVRQVALYPAQGKASVLRRKLIDSLRDAGVTAMRAAMLDRLPGFGRLVWMHEQGGFRRRLQDYLARERPEIAIAFMPRAMVALALARTEYPLVRIASTHSTPQRNFDSREDDHANPSWRAQSREALRCFDRIVVLLDEFRDWYPPDLRARVEVIPNAVTPDLPRVPRHTEKLVLTVGRHLPVKGHDLLIDAWARLAPALPDWRLEIFGRGPETQNLQARIDRLGLSRSVSLMGTEKDIARHYARAAILAHPSSQEGFALVVAEALSAEVPTVGFADCPGVNSLIRHGENGLLVEADDDREVRVEALARALEGLMRDTKRREAMAARAPASVARFASGPVMAQWENMINDCRKAQPRRSER